MALTDDLARRIKSKRQEIATLEQEMAAIETKILSAKSYVQALDDALRLAERSGSSMTASGKDPSRGLRKGSLPAKAYPVLKRVRGTLYLTALLEGMNVPVTPKNKRALASSLSAYARRGEIFTRPEPNTFGLVEFEGAGGTSTDEPTEQPTAGQSQLKLAR